MNKTEASKELNKGISSVLAPVFKLHDFKKFKSTDYVRIVDNDLLQYVNFQKHSWQTKFTCNIGFNPLYIPYEHRVFTFDSIRIGEFFSGKDFWWKYGTMNEMETSIKDLCKKIEQYIFPFFNEIHSNQKLLEYLTKPKKPLEYIFKRKNDFERFRAYPEQFNKELGYLKLRTGNKEEGNKLLQTNYTAEQVIIKLNENMAYTSKNWKLEIEKYKADLIKKLPKDFSN